MCNHSIATRTEQKSNSNHCYCGELRIFFAYSVAGFCTVIKSWGMMGSNVSIDSMMMMMIFVCISINSKHLNETEEEEDRNKTKTKSANKVSSFHINALSIYGMYIYEKFDGCQNHFWTISQNIPVNEGNDDSD